MLTLAALIVPSIIATFIAYKKCPEIRGQWILYTELIMLVITNLPVWGMLWIVGMRQYDIFTMSSHFLIKWLLLGTSIGIFTVSGWIKIKYEGMKKLGWDMMQIFPVAVFFAVTVLVYAPASLYLNNISEFNVAVRKVVPVLGMIGIIGILMIMVIGGVLLKGRGLSFYTACVFTIGFGMYIQSSFLNPQFPEMDGAAIDWSKYQKSNIISSGVWIGIFLIIIGLAIFKTRMIEKGIKYLSYLLVGMQLVSLVVLCFTCRVDEAANIRFSKEGEFELSREKNIIVFVIDTLQADTLQKYVESEYYEEGLFDDFTFFVNTVSGGAPTNVAFPVLLSGNEYDPMQPVHEYLEDVWGKNQLHLSLEEEGYDARLYTEYQGVPEMPIDYVPNCIVTDGASIVDGTKFIQKMYQLTGFYLVPQCIKKEFWMSTNEIIDTIGWGDMYYNIDNGSFYHDVLQIKGIETNEKKAFRLYHLQGVHRAFCRDEELRQVIPDSVTEEQVMRGVAKELGIYLKQLKENEFYDQSMIVILGDHGRHEEGNIEANPAMMIKMPGEQHELQYSTAPVSFRNLYATLVEGVEEDSAAYGASVFDVSEDSDVERMHTINATVMERTGTELEHYKGSYARLIIQGDAGSGNYTEWDPSVINRMEYSVGDAISFLDESDPYADYFSHRFLKMEDGAIIGHEASMCLNLENYNTKELVLKLKCAEVYGNSQTAKIYVNGYKIGEYELAQGDTDKELSFMIPVEHIEDDRAIIRMVFPKAIMSGEIEKLKQYDRDVAIMLEEIQLEEYDDLDKKE